MASNTGVLTGRSIRGSGRLASLQSFRTRSDATRPLLLPAPASFARPVRSAAPSASAVELLRRALVVRTLSRRRTQTPDLLVVLSGPRTDRRVHGGSRAPPSVAPFFPSPPPLPGRAELSRRRGSPRRPTTARRALFFSARRGARPGTISKPKPASQVTNEPRAVCGGASPRCAFASRGCANAHLGRLPRRGRFRAERRLPPPGRRAARRPIPPARPGCKSPPSRDLGCGF